MSSDKLPQIGLYCHKFGKTGKIKSKVSSSSSRNRLFLSNSSSAYIPLRCNSDGTFSLYNDRAYGEITMDVYRTYCTGRGRLYPVLKKHTNETELCSDIGVDGRKDDLSNHVHYVEIGWNMSAMNFGTRLPPMKPKNVVGFAKYIKCKLIVFSVYFVSYTFILVYAIFYCWYLDGGMYR